jgi:DnaJ-class molecular chaperone
MADAKRGLACPECQGFGIHEDQTRCDLCGASGLVSIEQIEAWRARRGDDADG